MTKLMAQSIYWLARFPDQRRALVENPDLSMNAAEEFLRFDPPSQYQGRWLTRNLEVHGVKIPPDAGVERIHSSNVRGMSGLRIES